MKTLFLVVPMVAAASIVFAQSGNVQDTKGKTASPAITNIHKYPGQVKKAGIKSAVLPKTQFSKRSHSAVVPKNNNDNKDQTATPNKTK